MNTSAHLRRDAEALTGALPALFAVADRLAANVHIGVHGRKHAGTGESFWQYRQAMPGDELARVDWRRSARSDTVYIREQELESAHTVAIWCDNAQSMAYMGKNMRARLLALALSILLSNAGERIALPGTIAGMPRMGTAHLHRITQALSAAVIDPVDYGHAPGFGNIKAARSVFLSDFLGPEKTVFPALKAAAARAGTGCLVQIIDKTEEDFPFDGRIKFESMGGGISFETHRAKALKEAYHERFAARSAALADFAREHGWHYQKHHADGRPQAALLWLYQVIGQQA
ncbi:MAG: DUF58 domain-containing protein [Paracoccaceae bacterium]